MLILRTIARHFQAPSCRCPQATSQLSSRWPGPLRGKRRECSRETGKGQALWDSTRKSVVTGGQGLLQIAVKCANKGCQVYSHPPKSTPTPQTKGTKRKSEG